MVVAPEEIPEIRISRLPERFLLGLLGCVGARPFGVSRSDFVRHIWERYRHACAATGLQFHLASFPRSNAGLVGRPDGFLHREIHRFLVSHRHREDAAEPAASAAVVWTSNVHPAAILARDVGTFPAASSLPCEAPPFTHELCFTGDAEVGRPSAPLWGEIHRNVSLGHEIAAGPSPKPVAVSRVTRVPTAGHDAGDVGGRPDIRLRDGGNDPRVTGGETGAGRGGSSDRAPAKPALARHTGARDIDRVPRTVSSQGRGSRVAQGWRIISASRPLVIGNLNVRSTPSELISVPGNQEVAVKARLSALVEGVGKGGQREARRAVGTRDVPESGMLVPAVVPMLRGAGLAGGARRGGGSWHLLTVSSEVGRSSLRVGDRGTLLTPLAWAGWGGLADTGYQSHVGGAAGEVRQLRRLVAPIGHGAEESLRYSRSAKTAAGQFKPAERTITHRHAPSPSGLPVAFVRMPAQERSEATLDASRVSGEGPGSRPSLSEDNAPKLRDWGSAPSFDPGPELANLLARRVYSLIVERVRRERRMRGH
jgi:hypothetical protein